MKLPLLIATSILAIPLASYADPVTYTLTLTASGALDGTSFRSSLVTFTGSGDTSQVVSSGNYDDIALPIIVTVAGVGSDTFTGTVDFVASSLYRRAGVAQFSPTAATIFYDTNPAFFGYDLQSSIGPITQTSGNNSYNGVDPSNPPSSGYQGYYYFPTTGGTFNLNINAGYSTFTADVTSGSVNAVSATPEPSSLIFLSTGIAGLAGAARRKLRRA